MTVPEVAGPPRFTRHDRLGAALRDPRARWLLEQQMPELRDVSTRLELSGHPIALVVATSPSLVGEGRAARLIEELERLPRTEPERPSDAPTSPRMDYDAAAPTGAAEATFPTVVHRFDRFEITLSGPSHGNPFVDVELSATVDGPNGAVVVPGFYDDAGTYRIRYLVPTEGTYHFTTSSTARSLHSITGSFRAIGARPGATGPVRVKDTFHFAFESGQRYLPIGTTAYAWTHQGDALEEQTIRTLRKSPFNKIRMCIFPKSYIFNENEPPRYPFPGDGHGGFDLQRFDIEYWSHLEDRIAQLGSMGIQADLILFHPYDRWGFADMGEQADDRYLKYAIARLAAFDNVWWSLANEYDLMKSKTERDWERFAKIVQAADPTGHLLSIHNCFDFYDYSRTWVTHASIQRQDLYKTSEMTTEWRSQWNKPVVIDECAYEGNIDQGWGNISGKEMVRRFWEGAVRGGYVGHGETYLNNESILWWSKGGELVGESPARIAFLREILDDAPSPLEPLSLNWDAPSAGIQDEYYLIYFGFNQPRYRRFVLDPTVGYSVDIIDTWNMTIDRLPDIVRGRITIELPGRPYMALRLRAVTEQD